MPARSRAAAAAAGGFNAVQKLLTAVRHEIHLGSVVKANVLSRVMLDSRVSEMFDAIWASFPTTHAERP